MWFDRRPFLVSPESLDMSLSQGGLSVNPEYAADSR